MGGGDQRWEAEVRVVNRVKAERFQRLGLEVGVRAEGQRWDRRLRPELRTEAYDVRARVEDQR